MAAILSGCGGPQRRDAVWLPVAGNVRARLASQTSLRADAPPVDVSYAASVSSINDRGTDGLLIGLQDAFGRNDTLVLSLPDASVVPLEIGQRIRLRFVSRSFGGSDRRAAVVVRDRVGRVLLLIQDSDLLPDTILPTPLTVVPDERVTYTVATREQDFCYRVVEHRAFRVFDGFVERTLAPGDPALDFESDELSYKFVPVEHRVEVRADSCETPLTPRILWFAYAQPQERSPLPFDDEDMERSEAVP